MVERQELSDPVDLVLVERTESHAAVHTQTGKWSKNWVPMHGVCVCYLTGFSNAREQQQWKNKKSVYTMLFVCPAYKDLVGTQFGRQQHICDAVMAICCSGSLLMVLMQVAGCISFEAGATVPRPCIMLLPYTVLAAPPPDSNWMA